MSDDDCGILKGEIGEGTELPPFTAPKDTCQQLEIGSPISSQAT
jgi:hypothetical protein